MIEVDKVSVVNDQAILLAPTSFAARRGEALVIRGRNGSGKSTLLRILSGAQAPSSGSVAIAGRPVDQRSSAFRRRVAAMIGLPPMAPDLTIRDHVLMIAATWLDDPEAATALATKVIGELGLDEFASRFPHELSSGQIQLFGIALVLARPFEVLILDEPEQRLDQDRVGTVVRVLAARRDEGAAVVVATHSAVIAEALADRDLSLDAAA